MKALLLAIAVLLYIQPVAADVCDMATGHDTGEHVTHEMDMDHDCCGDDSAGAKDKCDHAVQCGTITATAIVLNSHLAPAVALTVSHNGIEPNPALHPSHSPPPFKPPIC